MFLEESKKRKKARKIAVIISLTVLPSLVQKKKNATLTKTEKWTALRSFVTKL